MGLEFRCKPMSLTCLTGLVNDERTLGKGTPVYQYEAEEPEMEAILLFIVISLGSIIVKRFRLEAKDRDKRETQIANLG